MNRILRYALALAHTVIEYVRIDGDRAAVGAGPWKGHGLRCPACGRACECYDRSPGPRSWRAMDLARSMCFLEYRTRRVSCPEHGVLVESVPWARHKARFTRDFEDWVACLAVRCTASAVTELTRIEWRTVGGICARVHAGLEAADAIKGSRFALVKNPGGLTDVQREKLDSLKKRAGSRLFGSWGLKEGLRAVFRAGSADDAARLLETWLHDAAYCKIKPVVAVEKKVRRRKADAIAAVELGIGSGRVEAINNKIKVTVKMGYGFRNTDNLVALLVLRCSDCRPYIFHSRTAARPLCPGTPLSNR